MPPNQSPLAPRARDQHALGNMITGLGRCHQRLCNWLARVNTIRLHWDPQYHRPTETNGNLPSVPERCWLPGMGLALCWTCYLQAQCSEQLSYRLWHPVYKPLLDPGMFSVEYWPSGLDSMTSTDRRTERGSEPDDGAVFLGFLQLWAGQLGWTLTTSWIRLQ